MCIESLSGQYSVQHLMVINNPVQNGKWRAAGDGNWVGVRGCFRPQGLVSWGVLVQKFNVQTGPRAKHEQIFAEGSL